MAGRVTITLQVNSSIEEYETEDKTVGELITTLEKDYNGCVVNLDIKNIQSGPVIFKLGEMLSKKKFTDAGTFFDVEIKNDDVKLFRSDVALLKGMLESQNYYILSHNVPDVKTRLLLNRLNRVNLSGYLVSEFSKTPANDITFDEEGNLYAAQKTKVLKITSSGDVTDFAGNDTPGNADGHVLVATFDNIKSLCYVNGVFYIAANNGSIRVIFNETVSTLKLINATAANAPGELMQELDSIFEVDKSTLGIYCEDQPFKIHLERVRGGMGGTFEKVADPSAFRERTHPHKSASDHMDNKWLSHDDPINMYKIDGTGTKVKMGIASTSLSEKLGEELYEGPIELVTFNHNQPGDGFLAFAFNSSDKSVYVTSNNKIYRIYKSEVYDLVNKDGKTALMLAKENGHEKVVEALEALTKKSGGRRKSRKNFKRRNNRTNRR